MEIYSGCNLKRENKRLIKCEDEEPNKKISFIEAFRTKSREIKDRLLNHLNRANSVTNLIPVKPVQSVPLRQNTSIPVLANPNKRIWIDAKTPPKLPLKRLKTEPLLEHHKLLSPCMNKKLVDEYGKDILQSMVEMDMTGVKFLDSHPEITAKVRARMIDWFVEIVCNFNWHPNTFYLATKIFDLYFSKSVCPVTLPTLHLLGVTSIFIASKALDLVPFRLKTVYAKIGHQALSQKSILVKEKEVLETLGFMVNLPTVREYFGMFLVGYFGEVNSRDFKVAEVLWDWFGKVAMYDYGFWIMSINNLAAAVIYVAFQVMQKLGKHPSFI